MYNINEYYRNHALIPKLDFITNANIGLNSPEWGEIS